MAKIVLYLLTIILLFSMLHYIVYTGILPAQLDISVPVRAKHYNTVTYSEVKLRNASRTLTHVHGPQPVQPISEGKNNIIKEDNWLHKIIDVVLGILSAISMFIKFLVDLTIIRIPQPSISEINASENKVFLNPLYTLIVLSFSSILAIILLVYLSRNKLVKKKHYICLQSSRHNAYLESPSNPRTDWDFKDVKTAIMVSFQHIYRLAREKLGLNEARTPREIALGFEQLDLGDDAWLIVSAFEELKYGGRIPGWLTLKDLREAVNHIDGKIMRWSSK